jgi:hypothetical protein
MLMAWRFGTPLMLSLSALQYLKAGLKDKDHVIISEAKA